MMYSPSGAKSSRTTKTKRPFASSTVAHGLTLKSQFMGSCLTTMTWKVCFQRIVMNLPMKTGCVQLRIHTLAIQSVT